MFGDDRNGNRQLKRLILMHSDITKTDHVFQIGELGTIHPSALRQQLKHVTSTLGDTEALTTNQMLPHVQGSLTGTQNIENGRILTG